MKRNYLFLICIVFALNAFSLEAFKNPYQSIFNKAYQLYPKVPKGYLEAIAYTQSRFSNIQPTQEGSCIGLPQAYGVMGLIENGKDYFRNNLITVAELSGYSVDEIKNSPEKNILAYARAYSIYVSENKLGSTAKEQIQPLIALSELPLTKDIVNNFALNAHLYQVYWFLNEPSFQQEYGFPAYTINMTELFGKENYKILSGGKVVLSHDNVSDPNNNSYRINNFNTVLSADYAPALWNAAATCNYSSRNGTAISAIVIHDVEGTYAGCISWFQNCASSVSAHYVLRSSDGQITQMVLEANKAWHVGTENSYTIGLEHEGYCATPGWYTTAMYTTSAALCKDICTSGYGINPLRCYNGPACNGTCTLGACVKIKGHQHYPNQTHNDPGQYWDWYKFYNLINNAPTVTTITTTSGTIYDSGGPTGNYTNDERTTQLIQPAGATNITLTFTAFDLELNWDYLYIYDGATSSAPLIGRYTGTTSPGVITSSGGSLLLDFRSDCATIATGFAATYTSTVNAPPPTDITAPTTQATSTGLWKTTTFTETFTDADNAGGSGVQKGYYTVNDFNGTEWRANNMNGFFMDEFTTAIHPDWTQKTGIWSVSGQALLQTDEVSSNTNIYAKLTQNLSDRYMYQFNAKISGAGTNRRAGLHFACTRPDSLNRYDGYFAWFRVDNNLLEIYKVTNNLFGTAVASFPMTVAAGTYYDYKVIYDRIAGKIWVYQNNILIGTYVDAAPYQNGTYISFRSANASLTVNDITVYRSRTSTASIAVGSATTNDIRFKNPNPQTPSAKIKSVCQDNANNISSVFLQDLNIDWTLPKSVDTVRDGVAADIAINTSRTQLSANWNNSFDTSSAIASYWYSIGTTAGATNVVTWTNNLTTTSVTQTGLNLTQGQMYYVNVKALNGAGLYSNVISSNGQLVDTVIVVQAIDNTIPTTQITSIGTWKTQNFVATATDADNAGGSGVQKGYYTVNDFNGIEWRANDQNGFFADDFTVAIHPDWTQKLGTWSVSSQALLQSDETLGNTNIYAKLNQSLSDRYLYHFNAKITGAGTTRRAGFHFACTRPDSSNRFDGYFAWFRVDNSLLEIYKVSNNAIGLPVASFPMIVNAGINYDYKLIFDRISGKIWVYQNNVLMGTYTDGVPYQNGTYISFRSGNASLSVNDLRVYRSRATTVAVSLGAAATNDIRYRNPNPQTPSAQIKSISQDSANNLSSISNLNLNIDWTSSSSVGTVRDGLTTDISVNTSVTSLSANWNSALDTNSAIDSYWYSVGTTAGATNVVTWTNNATATSVTKTGLTLTQGQMYYVNVKTLNGAGLYSGIISSNGQLVDTVVVIPPVIDNISPTTQALSIGTWKTQNFTTSFTDVDNTGGSGIQKGYYQVIDYNGTEWRANDQNGFFSDNFDLTIHPDWTQKTGTWNVVSQALVQSNETLANTNIYAKVKQNLSDRYLYHFTAKIDGAGTNRSAGFHFACTRPDSSNRYDGYYALLKADNNLLEIYKVTNNLTGAPVASFPMVVTSGQYYDYKIIYDRIIGKIWMYHNNLLIGTYVDAGAPYANGTYVSFRSVNAKLSVSELKVFRSHTTTAVNVSVGAASTNDIRYQNPDPQTLAAKIKSICQDSANNISAIYFHDVNVDWTIPMAIDSVRDGLANDIAVTNSTTQLSANWTNSFDTSSAVVAYWYSIGTTAGATNIVNWTSSMSATSITKIGLGLTQGQTYYFNVKAENGAGLFSTISSSNGQLVDTLFGSIAIKELLNQEEIIVFPNPFSSNITIKVANESSVKLIITDVLGQIVYDKILDFTGSNKQITLDLTNCIISAGTYNLSLENRAYRYNKLIIKQ